MSCSKDLLMDALLDLDLDILSLSIASCSFWFRKSMVMGPSSWFGVLNLVSTKVSFSFNDGEG